MNITKQNNKQNPKLLTLLRQDLRRKNNSVKTEQAYNKWVKEFVIFIGMRHPSKLNKIQVESI
ncbi:MAG: phage integrase N-terminal SAM-like domain-containing protein [Bacteroidetes bacterium]|nr:phage integrase N-terminal SAM-like domain-containing protein [Bacteroidota bacterium]